MSTENVQNNVLVLSRTNFVTFLKVENSNEEQWKLFGLWYKTERENAGKTQEDVAEAAEIHPKTVSRIENGEPTKRSTVIALAKAIGLNTDQAVKRAFVPENAASDFDDKVRIAFQGAENWSNDEKEKILESVRLFVAGVRAERAAKEGK